MDLSTLVIGGIIGWLASIFMTTNAQVGALANIIVGIVGSSLGFASISCQSAAAKSLSVAMTIPFVQS